MKKNTGLLTLDELKRLEAGIRPEKYRQLAYIGFASSNGKTWERVLSLWMALLVGMPFWPILLLALLPWHPDWLWPIEQGYMGCCVFFCFIIYVVFGGFAFQKLSELYKFKAYQLQEEWLADATEDERKYYLLARGAFEPESEP